MKKGNVYSGVVERVEFGDRGIVVCQEPGTENDGKLAKLRSERREPSRTERGMLAFARR